MFAARIVDRVSSIRGKLFGQLIGAAEALAEANGTDPESEGGLKLLLSQACAFDDSRSEFRNTILTAFRRLKFSDFVGLAKELEREKDQELTLKLARWFSCVR